MKVLWKKAFVGLSIAVVVGVIGVSVSRAQQQPPSTAQPPTTGAQTEHERHPAIHHAIRSLEHAKKYLEHAAHDFGGHREQALADCEKAIHQLRLCLEGDTTAAVEGGKNSVSQTQQQPPPTAQPPTTGEKTEHERHPAIHHAIRALEHAKEYLEHAAHDFGGHRKQALEDCEKAIQQLRLCLESDKK